MDSLYLAVLSLGKPRRSEPRSPDSLHACEIGLIGSSAELAMAACLVQAFGPSAIQKQSGFFKTFGLLLEEFRLLVRDSPAAAGFLFQDVPDSLAHRDKLIQKAGQFRLLPTLRAAGLHAGRGLTWEATVVQANTVAEFLDLLAQASRLRPYLSSVSRCPYPTQPRALLLEDLKSRLAEADSAAQVGLLSSIFLLLPDIPTDEPEWIQYLERVNVVPEAKDLSYLLSAASNALPASLEKISGEAADIRVKIKASDEGTLAIAPHYLKKSFGQIRDQWFADIGTANGRLEQGVFDPPPAETVRNVFAAGLDESGITQDGELLAAHQAWPFIAASLSCAGTPGPYWFLVKRSQDLGQLRALLTKASKHGPKKLSTNLEELRVGIEAIEKSEPLNLSPEGPFSDLKREVEKALEMREKLQPRLERWHGNTKKPSLTGTFLDLIRKVEEGQPVTPAVEHILAPDFPEDAKDYWARILAELSSESNDAPGMAAILSSDGLTGATTAARKAMRRIDFSIFGPPLIL